MKKNHLDKLVFHPMTIGAARNMQGECSNGQVLQHINKSWVLAGLINSQLIVIIYLLFMVFYKNNPSLYEIASSTRVVSDAIMKST